MNVKRVTRPDGLCIDYLRAELWAASVGHQVDLLAGNVLLFYGPPGDRKTFDDLVSSVLNSHDGHALELHQAKAERKAKIDENTGELIRQGFRYDGRGFSMSSDAQTNYLAILLLQSYPEDITDDADETYTLTAEKAPGFFGAAEMAKKKPKATGRALKQAVNSAATVAEVFAVVDGRKNQQDEAAL